jgi:hypothetical protein
MKKKATPHVPHMIMAAFEDSAARLGVQTDFVITAAIWVFCRQDTAIRHLLVSDFWLRGLSELEASAAGRRPKTFKERVHALVGYFYPASRHHSTHRG